uniref:Uncharacterized protein n=1 Tax=Avena sativa TaxID=4498 RepID=A0ACD5VNQ5_AVESA
MASEQNRREERAQAAAQKAADELAAARRDMHEPSSPGRRTGIFSSVQESARSLLGAVRDTFSGSVRDTPTAYESQSAGAMDSAGEKLGEYGGYASQKAEEGKESASDMAEAAKMKASETKDAAAEKTKETADAAARKTMETKDAAWETAEQAKEYMVDMEENARQALAGDAKDRKCETYESARQQGEEVRRRAVEKAEEEQRRTRQPSEEERSKSATENIFGAAQGLTQAFKEKMTMPTDVIEQKLAQGRDGGGMKGTGAGRGDADDENDVMTRVKAADQMTGTWFNDVGKMGEEGTGIKEGTDMKAALRAADDDEDVMLRVKAADHMTGQMFNDVGKMGEEGTGMAPARRAARKDA